MQIFLFHFFYVHLLVSQEHSNRKKETATLIINIFFFSFISHLWVVIDTIEHCRQTWKNNVHCTNDQENEGNKTK